MRLFLLWLFIVILVFIFPITLSFVYEWNIDAFSKITLNTYVLWSLFHFILQIIFSTLNIKRINKLPEIDEENQLSVGINMVGWKENPEILEMVFRKILEANPKKYIFISDGNEEDDKYIIDIFTKVFKEENHLSIISDEILHKPTNKIIKQIQDIQYVCILQPHLHKRGALYSGICLYEKLNYDYILFSDSDTVILKDTIGELSVAMYHNKNCAGITGNEDI